MATDLPRLIYHRLALSKELLLRAVTGTSFFTIRRWARGTASAGVWQSLNTEVPNNDWSGNGKHCHTASPSGLCHRLWFRSAQPQDAQESLLELQELLLAFMLFFCAVN